MSLSYLICLRIFSVDLNNLRKSETCRSSDYFCKVVCSRYFLKQVFVIVVNYSLDKVVVASSSLQKKSSFSDHRIYVSQLLTKKISKFTIVFGSLIFETC